MTVAEKRQLLEDSHSALGYALPKEGQDVGPKLEPVVHEARRLRAVVKEKLSNISSGVDVPDESIVELANTASYLVGCLFGRENWRGPEPVKWSSRDLWRSRAGKAVPVRPRATPKVAAPESVAAAPVAAMEKVVDVEPVEPPKSAAFIICLLTTDPARRETALGDFAEQYAYFVAKFGRREANIWTTWHLVASIGPVFQKVLQRWSEPARKVCGAILKLAIVRQLVEWLMRFLGHH